MNERGTTGTLSCKHKFQPRYSTRVPEYLLEVAKRPGPFELDGQPKYEQIYECDVCVRCGMTTKKPKESK